MLCNNTKSQREGIDKEGYNKDNKDIIYNKECKEQSSLTESQ